MALYEQSTAIIVRCVFLRNGQWDGAVVTANNSVVIVRNRSFWDNIAKFGSVLYVANTNVIIYNSNFSSNYAFQGGALNANKQCLVIICDGIFDSNIRMKLNTQPETSGGAIMMTTGGKLNIISTDTLSQ